MSATDDANWARASDDRIAEFRRRSLDRFAIDRLGRNAGKTGSAKTSGADAQLTLRSDGADDYRFANDLAWSGGPGYYFVRKPHTIVGCQCVFSGEHKDVERFRGEPAEDTGITSVFLGPRLVALHDRFSGEVAAEFPVSIQNTALQVVPDYRLRAAFALSW